MENFVLREINKNDEALILKWANEPECRNNSLDSHIITESEHKNWFLSILNSSDSKIYILSTGKTEIGQARIEINDSIGRISYSIQQNLRGMGYGKLIVGLLIKEIRKNFPVCKSLYAEVKKENVASQKIFEELGFHYRVQNTYYEFYGAIEEFETVKLLEKDIQGGVY